MELNPQNNRSAGCQTTMPTRVGRRHSPANLARVSRIEFRSRGARKKLRRSAGVLVGTLDGVIGLLEGVTPASSCQTPTLLLAAVPPRGWRGIMCRCRPRLWRAGRRGRRRRHDQLESLDRPCRRRSSGRPSFQSGGSPRRCRRVRRRRTQIDPRFPVRSEIVAPNKIRS